MKEISLTRGYSTLVDDDDYESLSAYKWKVVDSGKVYAARSEYLGGRKWRTVYMHRVLCNGITVDHINGNSLDNTRANLRSATRSEQAMNRKSRTGRAKGVVQRGRKYRAYVGNAWLGTFPSEKEAAEAYNQAAEDKYGEFARLNIT
jgi:hypothetical protein